MKKILFLTVAIMILGNTFCYAEGTCPVNPVFETQKAENKTDVTVSDNVQKEADKTSLSTENKKTQKEHKKRWWSRK